MPAYAGMFIYNSMLRIVIFLFILLWGFSGVTFSFEHNEKVVETIRAAGVSLDVIDMSNAELPGLQKVLLEGGSVIYVSTDGSLIFQGRVFRYEEDSFLDLTASWENRGRLMALREVPEEYFVTFSPSEVKTHIAVFTDVECPFCKKFHRDVSRLMEAGVAINYLPYPRSGVTSEGYEKLMSIWCSDEPKVALDNAKKGRRVKRSACESGAVSSSFELGQKMQIKGTPAVILPNGSMITGYIEADQLLKLLGIR